MLGNIWILAFILLDGLVVFGAIAGVVRWKCASRRNSNRGVAAGIRKLPARQADFHGGSEVVSPLISAIPPSDCAAPSDATFFHSDVRSAEASSEPAPLRTANSCEAHSPEALRPYDRTRKEAIAELKTDPRRYRRCPYEKVQLIAAYDGLRLPSTHEFRETMCHDLSAQGIAFYSETAQEFRQGIVALTSADAGERYMVFEIVRTSLVEHDGGEKYLNGCRFILRLPNESYPDGVQVVGHQAGF